MDDREIRLHCIQHAGGDIIMARELYRFAVGDDPVVDVGPLPDDWNANSAKGLYQGTPGWTAVSNADTTTVWENDRPADVVAWLAVEGGDWISTELLSPSSHIFGLKLSDGWVWDRIAGWRDNDRNR